MLKYIFKYKMYSSDICHLLHVAEPLYFCFYILLNFIF